MYHLFFVCIWLKNSIFGEFSNIYLLSAQNRVKWRHKIRPIAKNFRPILSLFARDDAKLMPGEVCQVSCRYSNKWRSYSRKTEGGRIRPPPPPGGGGLMVLILAYWCCRAKTSVHTVTFGDQKDNWACVKSERFEMEHKQTTLNPRMIVGGYIPPSFILIFPKDMGEASPNLRYPLIHKCYTWRPKEKHWVHDGSTGNDVSLQSHVPNVFFKIYEKRHHMYEFLRYHQLVFVRILGIDQTM